MQLSSLPVKVARKGWHMVRSSYLSVKYRTTDPRTKAGKMHLSSSLITNGNINRRDEDKTWSLVIDNYFAKRFDYLGMKWRSSATTKDREALVADLAPAHRKRSRDILEKIDDGYVFLDWQLDCVSGYHWKASSSHYSSFDVVKGDNGIDIKNPWETGRLQYLCQMAVLSPTDAAHRDRLWREFRNTVMDFYCFNPYGMGVQWACTMDVAIRAANIVTAYSIFMTENGELFEEEFDRLLTELIYMHGKFIVSNLEKKRGFSNNHYLADICGLVFVSSFMKCRESNKWFSFSVKEFIREVGKQFHPDGSNFESSTAYHCLAAEMVFYTAAVIAGQDLPSAHHIEEKLGEVLSRIHDFTGDVKAPDGKLLQIGDNDSGRFINLSPRWTSDNGHITEDVLDVGSVGELIGSLMCSGHEGGIITSVSESLAGGYKFSYRKAVPFDLPDTESKRREDDHFYRAVLPVPFNAEDRVSLKYYKDFGLIIWESEKVYFTLFFGQVGQCGVGGHSHNDKLSMTLYVDNTMVFGDPGSHTYTTDRKMRDSFRSYINHPFAINLEEGNKAEFEKYNTFAFNRDFGSKVNKISASLIQVEIWTKGRCFHREITTGDGGLTIYTGCNEKFGIGDRENLIFSQGYGR